MSIENIDQEFLRGCRSTVEREMMRVATLGGWSANIDVRRSLLGRLPTHEPGSKAPGFDAGIACCLDLIPRDRQQLAATLHANYSEEAVEQVRRETRNRIRTESESCWWLAASAFCDEGGVDAGEFRAQFDEAWECLKNPTMRQQAAAEQDFILRASFELRDGVAWALRDGGMQGAYIAGHEFAVQYAANHEIWFLGTFRPSLGLEDFAFSSETDDQGRPKSGPVHGSKQFVKCANDQELDRALEVVTRHFAR